MVGEGGVTAQSDAGGGKCVVCVGAPSTPALGARCACLLSLSHTIRHSHSLQLVVRDAVRGVGRAVGRGGSV